MLQKIEFKRWKNQKIWPALVDMHRRLYHDQQITFEYKAPAASILGQGVVAWEKSEEKKPVSSKFSILVKDADGRKKMEIKTSLEEITHVDYAVDHLAILPGGQAQSKDEEPKKRGTYAARRNKALELEAEPLAWPAVYEKKEELFVPAPEPALS